MRRGRRVCPAAAPCGRCRADGRRVAARVAAPAHSDLLPQSIAIPGAPRHAQVLMARRAVRRAVRMPPMTAPIGAGRCGSPTQPTPRAARGRSLPARCRGGILPLNRRRANLRGWRGARRVAHSRCPHAAGRWIGVDDRSRGWVGTAGALRFCARVGARRSVLAARCPLPAGSLRSVAVAEGEAQL